MNLTYKFVFVLFVLFNTLIRQSDLSDLTEPLIFNPNTLEIYTRSSDPSKENFLGPYAIACPLDTENKTENEIEKLITLDHKGLFVRKIFHSSLPQELKQCKKGFELAIAYKTGGTGDVFEFGYEVYCTNGRLPRNLHDVFYRDFAPVSYARSVWKQVWRIIKYADDGDGEDDDRVNHSKQNDHVDFVWLKKFGIRYNISSWNITELKYYIDHNASSQLRIKCKDHNLGIRFYNKKHRQFDGFYSAANQKKIFANVQLPEGSGCESTYECVKKYDLLPPYYFESYPGSAVSCSNLTTIPIWHQRTEELLNNLDKFLVAMSQLIPNKLLVIPDVHGVLSFPKRKSLRAKSTPRAIYLYPKKKRIPVPKIILKAIGYQTFNCNAGRSLCWFNLVIVIYNQPVITKEEKLCHEDKCREWGWERIKFTKTSTKEGNGSEYIYCCEWDESVRGVLGYQSENYISQNLNLYNFPMYDSKKYQHSYVNLKQQIEERMEQLEKKVET